MKSIKITQELKDKNSLFKNKEVDSIYTGSVPNKFWGARRIMGGYKERTDLHEVDGWYDIVRQELLPTQKLGVLYFDEENEVFTYSVIDKSETELQQAKISESQLKKSQVLRVLQEKKVVKEYQAIEDNNVLLTVKDLFPVWEPDMILKLGNKVQHFKDGELVLFRIEQSHTSQTGWEPEDNPALFTRVGYEGEVLDWVQPTGAQDAYNIGDRVLFEGKTYDSLIDGNTWSPTSYPQGWQIV